MDNEELLDGWKYGVSDDELMGLLIETKNIYLSGSDVRFNENIDKFLMADSPSLEGLLIAYIEEHQSGGLLTCSSESYDFNFDEDLNLCSDDEAKQVFKALNLYLENGLIFYNFLDLEDALCDLNVQKIDNEILRSNKEKAKVLADLSEKIKRNYFLFEEDKGEFESIRDANRLAANITQQNVAAVGL